MPWILFFFSYTIITTILQNKIFIRHDYTIFLFYISYTYIKCQVINFNEMEMFTMSNRIHKWLMLIFASITSCITVVYCFLMNYKRSIFKALITQVTENNEILYLKLNSATQILESSIYFICTIFFITICILYVLKYKRYSVAVLSIFIIPFILFLITLPFVIKAGYINYLIIPIDNLFRGYTIMIISLLIYENLDLN